MLQSRIQRPIPERLSHYTNKEALKNILSDQDGNGICMRAFSNKCKNDDQEIRMGEYMLNRILDVFFGASMLQRFGGYENTASVSFMEGDVNQHMLDEYGYYRLEFDLRNIGVGVLTDGLIDCEYVAEKELEEYADEYCKMICATYQSIPDLQKKYGKMSAPPINNLIGFIMMELDIMQKVFCLKEQKWGDESEWRKVFSLKPDDANVQYCNGKPYLNYYLDKNLLTGVTVFYMNGGFERAQKDADEIRCYISERGYKADVMVERFEKDIKVKVKK